MGLLASGDTTQTVDASRCRSYNEGLSPMDYQVFSCGMISTAYPVCKTGLSGPGATFVKAPSQVRTRKAT